LQLAATPDEEVFKMWEGLGYYSRCRNLLETARHIADILKGKFPSTYEEIRKLKGVGPYTAAAIASFAFNEKRAVVDGNVQRVLARYFGISTPADTTEGKKLFASLADSLIDDEHPAVYNQAIMDFGATVCRPKNPLCGDCVQSADCEAHRHGFVDQLPEKEKVLTIRSRWMYYFILTINDCVYIRKRVTNDIWQNLYEFVLLESDEELNDPLTTFEKNNSFGAAEPFTIILRGDVKRQQLTHQRISGRFFVLRLSKQPAVQSEYLLVDKRNLHGYAFPKFINSFLQSNPL
jgi:A/G-specific adenine glycosylase